MTIAFSQTENYELLIQKLMAIRSEHAANIHRELLEAKYRAGQAVIDSPLYDGKHKRGAGLLLQQICRDMGWAKTELYSCLQFYEAANGDMLGYLDGIGARSWTQLKKELKAPVQGKQIDYPSYVSRPAAVKYAAGCVGKTWTAQTQQQLEDLLGVSGSKRPIKQDLSRLRPTNT